MAAIAPFVAMILIAIIISQLAQRSAYKSK
jgi:hypothetical protein